MTVDDEEFRLKILINTLIATSLTFGCESTQSDLQTEVMPIPVLGRSIQVNSGGHKLKEYSCLIEEEVDRALVEPRAARNFYSVGIVQSKEDVQKVWHGNLGVNVDFDFFGFSSINSHVKFDIKRQEGISSRPLSLVVKQSHRKHRTLTFTGLADKDQHRFFKERDLHVGQPQAFRERCGDGFVSDQIVGYFADLHYEILFETVEEKEDFSRNLYVGADFQLFKASFQQNLVRHRQKSSKDISLNYSLYTNAPGIRDVFGREMIQDDSCAEDFSCVVDMIKKVSFDVPSGKALPILAYQGRPYDGEMVFEVGGVLGNVATYFHRGEVSTDQCTPWTLSFRDGELMGYPELSPIPHPCLIAFRLRRQTLIAEIPQRDLGYVFTFQTKFAPGEGVFSGLKARVWSPDSQISITAYLGLDDAFEASQEGYTTVGVYIPIDEARELLSHHPTGDVVVTIHPLDQDESLVVRDLGFYYSGQKNFVRMIEQ